MEGVSLNSSQNLTLASECMEFSKLLVSRNMSFTFSLSTPSGFKFSLAMEQKEPPSETVKKPRKLSPSTKKRNERRKREHLTATKENQTNTEAHIEDNTPLYPPSPPPPPHTTPAPPSPHTSNTACEYCNNKGKEENMKKVFDEEDEDWYIYFCNQNCQTNYSEELYKTTGLHF